ncbi:DNA-binding protein [Paraburkholderia sp. DHOC27]|nr:DNA-binding protein [Paraburkholderia sp. DHOC27]
MNVASRLSLLDVAALLRVSRKTIYNHVEQGLIPPPDGHVKNRPYWYSATIRPLVTGGAA